MTDRERQILKVVEDVEKISDLRVLFNGDAETRYREMVKIIHPDRLRGVEAGLRSRATQACSRLTEMYQRLTKSDPSTTSAKLVGRWVVERALTQGDLSVVYEVTSDYYDDTETPAIMKIVDDPGDNDLMESEAKVLQSLQDETLPKSYRRYVPYLLATFLADGRRVNVMTGDLKSNTLEHLRSMFRSGIPFRHVVWMLNRSLSALALLHNLGVCHGAVLPEHLIFSPSTHGHLLLDFTCSTSFANKVPLIVKNRKHLYPPEILGSKSKAGPTTDLYMLAKSMMWAAGKIPERFRNFFEWMTLESTSSRASRAFEVQDLLKQLAQEEYGPPTFVPLELPKTV